jgi:hypothetical protein
MTNRFCAGVIGALLIGAAAGASAQSAGEHSAFVGVKGGFNRENAEDGLRGGSGAGGISAGLAVTPDWTVDFELWIPAALRNGRFGSTHRDMLAGASAMRFFGRHDVRPFLLAGLSLARTEDRFTTCIADRVPFGRAGPAVPATVDCAEPDVRERRGERYTSASIFGLIGAGIDVAAGPRLRIRPEVRVNHIPTSLIVRPAVGLVVLF